VSTHLLTATVTVAGDSGVTNYARLINTNGSVVDEGSRIDDGDIVLTATKTGRYAVTIWSENADGKSKPTVALPLEFILYSSDDPFIKFESGSTTLILPAPVPGPTERKVLHQASMLTAAGARVAYDKGVKRYEVEIELQSLSKSQRDDLEAFYHYTVNGVANEFDFYDSDGTHWKARFLEPTLEFTRVAVGVYDVRMLLELRTP